MPEAAMKIPVTFFAPAEREPIEIVHRQAGSFDRTPVANTVFNAGLNYLLVVNACRQIVLASENVLDLVPDKTMDQIIGLRPGEALECIHSHDCDGGCGTSMFCCQCGAVKVILSGLAGSRDLEECHLVRVVGGRKVSLDLQVLATPLTHNQERYTLLTVADVRPDRRQPESN